MKHTLHTLTSRFLGILWLVTSVCMFVSCSDDTDETGGNFKLYYPDMTDIGPSMTGVKIPAPSFQGGTPSEFEITAVTLNDESIENPCFVIDAETGEITINSTAETPVGEYKLTISCSVNGKYFTFKDIIKVTFLPRAPEGTVAEPNHILVMYSVVSDPNNITKLPTAQVKTAGEHVSITKYSIGTVTVNGEVLDKPEEMFEVSSSGEISILKSERFERGVTYSISLKLETAATGDTPCIATDILAVEVASEPFSLEYPGYNAEEGWKISEEKGELKSSFDSGEPIFVGSKDDIKYWFEIEEEIEEGKILIDEKTGRISIPEGHAFAQGSIFHISVFVANKYLIEGKKLADVKLTVTKYYKPLEDTFEFYPPQTIEQAKAYTIVTNDWMAAGYENLTFALLNNWENLLQIEATTGKITISEEKIIPVNTEGHNIPFRVTNGDGTTKDYIFKLTVTENKSKFLWIKCGNNLGENGKPLEGDIYENQFRFSGNTNDVEYPIRTNLDGYKTITWSLSTSQYTSTGINCQLSQNALKFSGTPDKQGIVALILTGTVDGDKSQSLSVPIFVHANKLVGDYYVEYNPLVFRVNPKEGGISTKPNIKKKDGTIAPPTFALEYRRDFVYHKWEGGTDITKADEDLKAVLGNNLGSKVNIAYFTSTKGDTKPEPLDATKLAAQVGYVDNSEGAGLAVKVHKEKWKTSNGNYLQGFFRGQMIYEEQVIAGFNDSKNRIFPLMIWLDPDYYPVTE